MSKYRSLWKWILFLTVCAGIVWLVLHVTANYPELGEPVDYPVNDIPGIELTLEKQKWLPFTGHSFHWHMDVDTDPTIFKKSIWNTKWTGNGTIWSRSAAPFRAMLPPKLAAVKVL